MTSLLLAQDADKWACLLCVKLMGTLLWPSPGALAATALAMTVTEAGIASPAKLMQLCICFWTATASSFMEAGFDKSCWAEGSSPGMGEQQPCRSQNVSVNTWACAWHGEHEWYPALQPGFQSKQRGVGSHPHDSQHCCRSPFWKKCEIYCNTRWESYGGSELLNPLNLSLQLHWQGLSLHSAPSLWFHCSNIFPYMEAFLPQPGLILTCHCIWMLAHFSQLTLCKGRCLNLLLFK